VLSPCAVPWRRAVLIYSNITFWLKLDCWSFEWRFCPLSDRQFIRTTNIKGMKTSLCSASYLSCKRCTARIFCCAPCCGPVLLRCRPCSNRSISPTHRAGPTAANPPRAAAAGELEDRRTDRTVTSTLLRIVPSFNPAFRGCQNPINGLWIQKYSRLGLLVTSAVRSKHLHCGSNWPILIILCTENLQRVSNIIFTFVACEFW